jgi:hypothetical protein
VRPVSVRAVVRLLLVRVLWEWVVVVLPLSLLMSQVLRRAGMVATLSEPGGWLVWLVSPHQGCTYWRNRCSIVLVFGRYRV